MPDWVAYVRRRLPSLPCRPEREAEIVDELAGQLGDLYDAARADGASEDDALARVAAEVPDWQALASAVTSADHPISAVSGEWQRELRFAIRTLAASPLFTSVAVLTLALGIGTTTAMFSLVNSVVLRPLPFRDASRLMIVHETIDQVKDRYPRLPANARSISAWRDSCRNTCEAFGTIGIARATLTDGGEPEGLSGARVSTDLFDLLGVAPLHGRTFVAADATPGRDRIVVVSHALWQRRFGGDPAAVGRRLVLDGEAFEIVGVLPRRPELPPFDQLSPIHGVPDPLQYFVPLTWSPDQLRSVGDFDYAALVRLRAGATPQQAVDELSRITTAAFRETALRPKPLVMPLAEQIAGAARRPLWLLFLAVAAALVVACVNLANLLTARWVARRRELAIRTALGANMSALLRQVAAETATVALAGGILGLAAAHASIRMLIAFAPVDIPRLGEVALDARAFGFAATLIVTCAGVCVIIPAWRAWRTDAADVLKGEAHSTTASPAAARVRDILVGVEVGLTVGLLILAGLFLASFVRVLRVDPGFAVDRRVAIDLKLPAARYRTGEDRTRFIERLLPLVQSIPGVEAAGLAQKLPLEGEATVDSFIIDKPVPMATGLELVGNHYFASPSYFDAIGMAIVRGRMFAETDRGRRVAVVSELTARTLWPGQEPIGRRFARPDNRREAWEVIGIVANARMTGLEQASGLVAYVPYWDRTAGDMSLVVQSRVDGNSSIAANLRNVLRELDPELPLLKVRTIDDVVDRAVAVRRFQTLLTALFAAAGLLIACLGIYGVVVAAGERRRAELAVRLALGATRRDVVILVALQAAKPVMAGLVAGSIGAIAGARVIQSMLFEVSPNDPMVIAAVCALVLVIAALACVDPAARAARISPVTLLRTS